MGNYVAYLTPQKDSTGKINMSVTKSKLENSLYCIEGFKPNFFLIFTIKGIPKTERGFYRLIWKTFAPKPIVLEQEIQDFCEKYYFSFEKLRA
jgi:hypothetical protein